MDRPDVFATRPARSPGSGSRGATARTSSDGRIPPHNLPAEEAVLGAILLSREALGSVVEAGLRYDDFYKPAHQHIYDVACAVSQSGGPADTITVADELQRLGLLDAVGGVETLHALQNATPAISNAAHYAKIVQDAAMLRRLIMVAGDISELAYSGPENVDQALDEAETKVFKVADRRVTDTYAEIGELMKGAIERIEENYARGDTITGTATGYTDLDELLSGLQPSTLNIIGARPAMGKCVAWDTPMVDMATGELVSAAELFDRAATCAELHVLSLADDGGLERRRVSVCLDDGVKPVFQLTTAAGRTVTVTASHPLLTPEGWRPLRDIAVGTTVAIPSRLPVFGTDDPSPDEIDGYVRQACHAQRVPAAAFRLTSAGLRRFLDRLLSASDVAPAACGVQPGRRFTLASEAFAREVAHALLRVGWPAKVRLVGKAAELSIVEPGGPLPAAAWHDVDKAKGDLSWADLEARCGGGLGDRSVGPPRELMAELAGLLDDDRLRWWASPDIAWDEVVSVVPRGETRVVDFTVPGPHNFVAADLYLHNTAFGLGMATHVAKTTGRPVLVFSLEMGHVELTQRILSSEAEVDSTKIRNGRLSESDWAKIGRAIGRLEVPLYLDDNPRVTVMEIRAKARRLKMQRGDLAMILVDYLQLMSGGGNSENRQLEVSEISRNLKILARELEVPIVALSQLSRNLESRSDKKPMLSDLRESGSLEQDADVVMFLYRDEVYNKESPDRGAADLIVAKHRAGPIGDMRLVFRGQYARFDNAAPRSLG